MSETRSPIGSYYNRLELAELSARERHRSADSLAHARGARGSSLARAHQQLQEVLQSGINRPMMVG